MNKKNIIISTLLCALLMFVAGQAMAASGTLTGSGASVPSPTGFTYPPLSVDVSPSVSIAWNAAANAYAMTSFHSGGTAVYGIQSSDSVVYFLPSQTSITAPSDQSIPNSFEELGGSSS